MTWPPFVLLGPRSFRARAISSFSWDQVRLTLIMNCAVPFIEEPAKFIFFTSSTRKLGKSFCAAALCIKDLRTFMLWAVHHVKATSNPSQMLTTARMLAKAFIKLVSRLAILSLRLSRNQTGANSQPAFVHLEDFTNLTRPNIHRYLCHLLACLVDLPQKFPVTEAGFMLEHPQLCWMGLFDVYHES